MLVEGIGGCFACQRLVKQVECKYDNEGRMDNLRTRRDYRTKYPCVALRHLLINTKGVREDVALYVSSKKRR